MFSFAKLSANGIIYANFILYVDLGVTTVFADVFDIEIERFWFREFESQILHIRESSRRYLANKKYADFDIFIAIFEIF